MAEIVAEQISVRLNDEQKQLLDDFHKKRPALSRAGCLVQMIYEMAWQAEENSKMARLKRIEETLSEHGALLRLLCDKLNVEVPHVP